MKRLATLSLTMFLNAGAIAAGPDCQPQSQVDVGVIEAQVVLVGEAHGTNGIPAFVDGLVCSFLKAGRPVILAVEHDGDEQDAMNRYLASGGGPLDRQSIMQGRTWKTYSDGRSSTAMFALVESVRKLRQAGQRVGVLAFRRSDNLQVPMEAADRVMLAPADNALQNRLNDADMASSIQYAAILYRRYVVVVLAGYSHTSTILSHSDYPMFGTYSPMGQLVSEAMPTFVIGIDTAGGEHWHGEKTWSVKAEQLVVPGSRTDAIVRIDRLTASPLARDALAAEESAAGSLPASSVSNRRVTAPQR